MRIAMTAPVITNVSPGLGPNCESNFTMSFYVPKVHWDETPNPTGDGVFLEQLPTMDVYVRCVLIDFCIFGVSFWC